MRRLSTFNQVDYCGGLNDTDSAYEIKRNQGSILRNWVVRSAGKLIRRDGISQIGSTLTNQCQGLFAFLQGDGDKDLLAMDGTTLKYLNSTTFSSLDSGFSGSLDFDFSNVPSLNRVYIGNEDNQLHYWDRASTTLNSCLTDLGAAVPHGNILMWHKNFMFHMNNVNVSGTKYPNRFYWSALGDPGTYDTANDFVDTPGGGRLITAAELGDDALVLFKENSIKFLTGFGDTDWTITATSSNVGNIDEAVGIAGPRALVNVGDEVWFVDDEGKIRRLYQTDFGVYRKDIISSNIEGSLAGVNRSQLSKVKAWIENDYVFFAFPNAAATHNDIVFVFDIIAAKRNAEKGGKFESWTTFTGWSPDFFISYFVNNEPKMLFSNYSDKKIYLWDSSAEDDNGVAVDARWDSKNDYYDKPVYKRYYYGYLWGETASDATATLYASVDENNFVPIKAITLTAGGSRLGPTGTFRLGPTGTNSLGGGGKSEHKFYYQDSGGVVTGRSVQHSIRHATIGEKPIIDTFTSYYKSRTIR